MTHWNNAHEAEPENEYFQATDQAWYQATRHQLNPLDWAYVEAWYEASVPIACLLNGIARAVASFRKANGNAPIHSIAYCAQAIIDKWAAAAPNLAATYDPERTTDQ